MYTHFNNQFGQEITTIHPGEYMASSEDIVLSTVLGSCISVALFDRQRQIGGLNHFMLPGQVSSTAAYYESNTGKYGMYAMELLINQLIKLGARKDQLQSKVFGGASVLVSASGSYQNRVPKNNIEFAFTYLATEGIPVISQDVGGTLPRKIFFYPKTAKVLLKRISGTIISTLRREEEEYLRSIQQKTKKGGEVTLF